jgi:hypothetical protein
LKLSCNVERNLGSLSSCLHLSLEGGWPLPKGKLSPAEGDIWKGPTNVMWHSPKIPIAQIKWEST